MAQDNQPTKTLLLTGASRGIGHATVKRFGAAGWRVLTVSRHEFSEHCPWDGGPRYRQSFQMAAGWACSIRIWMPGSAYLQ